LQAGGHRFDPGTLHLKTRWKRRVFSLSGVISHQVRPTALDEAAHATQAVPVHDLRVRRLIAAYAGLWVLFDLIAVIPGTGLSSAVWGLVASIAIQSLLVWRLSLGSATAWTVGLVMALLAAASVFLMATPLGVGVILIVVVFLAQAGILLSAPVRDLARSHRQIPPAAA
jgi:hypothetical protein